MSNLIEKGDRVVVNFNCSQWTLSHDATVIYKPVADGDSWIVKDNKSGQVHYISEPCTISKIITP